MVFVDAVAGGHAMGTAHLPAKVRSAACDLVADLDIADRDLLGLVLGFAGQRGTAPAADELLAEYGDIDVILAGDPDDLRDLGLSDRAVAIIKLLHAFQTGARHRHLLH